MEGAEIEGSQNSRNRRKISAPQQTIWELTCPVAGLSFMILEDFLNAKKQAEPWMDSTCSINRGQRLNKPAAWLITNLCELFFSSCGQLSCLLSL